MNTRLSTPLNNYQLSVLDLKPFAHIDALIKHVLPAASRMIISRGRRCIIIKMMSDSAFCLFRAA